MDELPKRRGRPPSGGREAILEAALALMAERGVARLHTKEVAERAGVSEASVYYHYTDKAGLLTAVVVHGLEPLHELDARGLGEPGDTITNLTTLAAALEAFMERVLPVFAAAQSDVELRDAMRVHLNSRDLGPHRGVRAVARYLAGEQEAGRVDAAADPDAAGLMLLGAVFLRAWQRTCMGDGASGELPARDRTVAALAQMLGATPEPSRARARRPAAR